MLRRYTIVFIVGCLTTISVLAQNACETVINDALNTTEEQCSDIGRNQTCYGHTMIDATLRGDATFDDIGDITDLANLESIRLSTYDDSAGTWGVGLMQVQANVPNSVPGQGVRILLFGDTEVENKVPYVAPLTIVANANTRLRSSPSSANDFNILTAVNAGQELIANARTEDGEWLRASVSFANGWGTSGWIAAIVVDGDADRMSLPVAEASEPNYGPLQAFYLSTGINGGTCETLPDNGLIVQTPQGAGSIEFLINEVNIRMGSTAFLQVLENNLRVNLLEGSANVSANGTRQFLVPGTFTEVELDPDTRAAIGTPAFLEPIPQDVIDRLPLDAPPEGEATEGESEETGLIAVDPAEPPSVDEVDALINETYGTEFGIAQGWYRISVTNFEQVIENPMTDGYCASGGNALEWLVTNSWDSYDFQGTFNADSFTSFTFTTDSSTPELGGCIVSHRAVWVPIGPTGQPFTPQEDS